MRAYFLSDLHLIDGQEIHSLALFHFLNSQIAKQATHLFFMGDIFDLWISKHNYFVEQFADIIESLKKLKSLGVEIYFFEGNHDLYLKDYFEDVLGFRVIEEPTVFRLGEMRVRLEHGDLMNPNDAGYRFLKWFLHTPVMRGIARGLPERWVAAIGTRMSSASRKYTSSQKFIDSERLEKMTDEYVNSQLGIGWASGVSTSGSGTRSEGRHSLGAGSDESVSNFDVFLAGHIHHRFLKQDKVSNRIVGNLGWWKFERRILEVKSVKDGLTILPGTESLECDQFVWSNPSGTSSYSFEFKRLNENGDLESAS